MSVRQLTEDMKEYWSPIQTQISCYFRSEVWMIAGTAKKRKSYPVHEAFQRLTQPVRDTLLSFHALTRCDTTSSFSGQGKKSCWKTFQKHPFLVSGVGHDGELPTVEDLCVTYVTHRNSQPPTMPDCSCLVRPRRVWRCFLQLDMPLTFMEYVLSTRQRCCCKQTKNIYMFHP